MNGVVCAVAMGRLRQKDSSVFIVDPRDDELPLLESSGTFAFLFSESINSSDGGRFPHHELVWCDWQSTPSFKINNLNQVGELARAAALQVWQQIKVSVEQILTGTNHI